jgi:S1-C subfamily serine protease
VADVDAPLKEQIFDLPQRQRIADIHHHREADHLRRAVEITEGSAHRRRLRILVRSLKPIYSDNATQPFLGKAQDARRVAQIALPSVVLIVAQDANRQPLSQGSGFVVGDGLIATSLHVIEGAYAGSVKFGSKLYPILGIAALDQSRDLAVLSVPGVSGALTIGDTERIAIGDKIYAAGNPMGLEGTISEGIVSGVRDRAKSVLFFVSSAHTGRFKRCGRRLVQSVKFIA